MSPQEQAHFRVLRIINDSPDITQRELARQLQVSVGKANYLLKALVQKGQVKIDNFKRSKSKLKYAYLLTPKGIRERVRLTRAYLARMEVEYEALKAEIETLD